MTELPLTESELRARLSHLAERHRDAKAFAMVPRADRLNGHRLQAGGREFVVRSVISSLDARDALREAETNGASLVILTDLKPRELGADVMARVARNDVLQRKLWDILREELRATGIDPRVAREVGIAEILISNQPSGGWPKVTTGHLDARQARGMVLSVALSGIEESADLQSLLEWSLAEGNVDSWRRTVAEWTEDHVQVVLRIVEESAGELAAKVLHAVGQDEIDGPVAWGLVAQCLAEARDNPIALKILGKLEDRLEIADFNVDLLQEWGRAAITVVQKPDLREELRTPAKASRQIADELLADLGGAELAAYSDLLPSGFSLRIDEFAKAVDGAVDRPSDATLAEVEQLGRRVRSHEGDDKNKLRRTRVDMIVRLLRWIREQAPLDTAKPSGLGEALETYRMHGGLVDYARAQLWRPESHESLAAAMRKLDKRVREMREEQNRRFASAFSTWLAHGSPGPSLLPIESVLDEAVAPIAEKQNVLLVVLDGMSMAVYRELLPSLADLGWTEVVPADTGRRWGVVAAVPSVTEYSRTSLLCGRLARGDQNTERDEFPTHKGLATASVGGEKPKLFHKRDFGTWTDTGKAQAVFAAVRDPKQRVVGVVLNDIDDYLSKHEPSVQDWSAMTVDPLAGLLETATEANRVVIITSDHGHIIDQDTTYVPEGTGERYRIATADPSQYEIVAEGERVNDGQDTPGHRVTVPWSETVRYAKKKFGYHGGVSPQEIVVPLGVFVGGAEEPEDWKFAVPEIPRWWDPEAHVEVPKPKPRKVPATKKKAPKVPPGQDTLFPTADPGSGAVVVNDIPLWVEALFASEMYQSQRAQAGPAKPAEEPLKKLLAGLEGRRRLSLKAVQQVTGMPRMRIRQFLSVAARVLNVDGYAVLDVGSESGEVRLNVEYLEAQFEVKVK